MSKASETRARNRATDQRIAEAKRQTAAIVATGKCPTCGCGLKQNLSITGWWQCRQFGAAGFRADSSLPSCEWQGFV